MSPTSTGGRSRFDQAFDLVSAGSSGWSSGCPTARALVVLAYVLKGHLDLEATTAELARRKEAKFVVHATEDAIYRYWDTWLTTGEVPHLFRVDLETGQPIDLTPASTRWWNWPNTDDPLDSFDISPDGRHIAYVADSSEPPHLQDQAAPLRTRPRDRT